MSRAERPGFLRDCLSEWEAAANGVTPKTNVDRQKYWNQWTNYSTATGINPFLEKSVPPDERDIVAGEFAARVRTGRYGRGNQIKVSGVTDALAATPKNIEIYGQPGHIYRVDQKYQLLIEQVVEVFQRVDPPSVPQLAVPITLPHKSYTGGLASLDPFIRRIGCLILVESYFFLRVSKYIRPKTVIQNGKRVSATHTKQFVVGNVRFFRNGVIMPRNSPLDVLLTADLAVLKFSNQKNECMGQTIPQHAIGITMCPVHALDHIVYNILAARGDDSTLLYSVAKDGDFIPVECHHIIAAVHAKAEDLKLNLQAIDPDLVG